MPGGGGSGGKDLIKKSGLEDQERESPNTPIASAAAADTSTDEMSFDQPLLGGQCNEPEAEEEASSDKSSIGKPDDDSDDEDEDEDEEEVGSTTTLSLASLEDSLPIKKGLSKHYSGKGSSFGDLAEAKSVMDLPKPDNPLNKRRRTLMANELHTSRKTRKSDSNQISVPLLPDQDDDDHHIDHQHQQQQQHQHEHEHEHEHEQSLGLGHDNNTTTSTSTSLSTACKPSDADSVQPPS